jgi:outer membrane protein TolC
VLNFRIRVNDARSDLVRSEYSFATARSVLAELLGLTEGTLAAGLFPPLGEATSATLPDVDVFLDLALANRPDLAALREALKSAKYRLYARYGAFLPTVTLHSDFGWQRSDNDYSGRWKFRTRTQDRNFNYGVTGQWELFDGGGRWFALRESQADLAQSMESLTEAWIAIVAQVRQAHDNRKQQAILAAIAAENLELVQKTRDLVEEEYKAGNTSLTRLNEAQRDLIIAENNLVSARINLANARLNLDAVTAAIDLPEPPK